MGMASFFFSPHGRIDRSAFFSFHAVVLVAMLALGFGLSFIPVNVQIGVNILWLLLLWPFFCLSAKRLHDTGHSARLLGLFVPEIALSLILQVGVSFAGGLIAALVNTLAIICHMVSWGLILYLTLKSGDGRAKP